eukprot:Colp12_sorted_trinity150504_noHs@10827
MHYQTSSIIPMPCKLSKQKKHVVVDKPACLSMSEFEDLIQASRENNVMFSVFHNRRWDGDFLTVKKLLKEGTLGDVRWIEAAYQKGTQAWRHSTPLAKGGGSFF